MNFHYFGIFIHNQGVRQDVEESPILLVLQFREHSLEVVILDDIVELKALRLRPHCASPQKLDLMLALENLRHFESLMKIHGLISVFFLVVLDLRLLVLYLEGVDESVELHQCMSEELPHDYVWVLFLHVVDLVGHVLHVLVRDQTLTEGLDHGANELEGAEELLVLQYPDQLLLGSQHGNDVID